MKNLIWILAIIFLLFHLPYSDVTQEPSVQKISGQVAYVIDGDTFQLSNDNLDNIKIRIAEIDAPELTQPYGKKAKSYLKKIVESKTVICTITEKDRYGRYIAKVKVPAAQLDVAAEMIKAGYAWHYKKYSTSQELANIEIKVKSQKKELWSDHNAIAPWIYRKNKNNK